MVVEMTLDVQMLTLIKKKSKTFSKCHYEVIFFLLIFFVMN